MTRQEADFEDSQAGSEPFQYPDDEVSDSDNSGNSAVDLRTIQIRSMEAAVKLLLSARGANRVQHMRASVAIAILNGDGNLQGIADHFRVTYQRIKQIEKEIKHFEISARP